MVRIIVFGGNGGLGKKVVEKLRQNYEVYAPKSTDIDITTTINIPSCYDVVINLAGYNYDAMAHKQSIDETARQIAVNTLGTCNVVNYALSGMRKQEYGRIILISSVLSNKIVFGSSVYSACKAFVDRFAKSVSAENISKGITCNTIQLGYFDGGMTNRLSQSPINKIGLGRLGTIDELVNAIVFIINNEYLTGANIELNGGVY